MIGSAGLKILPVDSLEEAARISVKLSGIMGIARTTPMNINFEMPI